MYKMDQATSENIKRAFLDRFGGKPQGGGKRYKYGICPSCSEKKLWMFTSNPWTVQCDSKSCGYKESTKELFPNLFQTYAERFDSTKTEDPKAAAKAYLSEKRGFNITRIGEYTQGAFNLNGKYSPTVCFTLENGAKWERIIDSHEEYGDQKANFMGQYGGFGWIPPEFNKEAKEFWIVEGIFDALALQEHGISAISAMSCHNFPRETLQKILDANPNVTAVIALDDNKAGRDGMNKFLPALKEMGFTKVRAALTGSKQDWNDLHISGRLTEHNIRRYKYNGGLAIASSKEEKAMIMFARNGYGAFYMEFDYRTYWVSINLDTYHKHREDIFEENKGDWGVDKTQDLNEDQKEYLQKEAFRRSNSIQQIGTCVVDILYAERDLDTDETAFYVNILQKHRSNKGIFTGKQFKSANEFGARVIDILPGANFDGTAQHINQIYNDKAEYIKMVSTINYVGYCPEVGAYIYNNFAVKDGVVYLPNDEDYYEFEKDSVKSTLKLAGFSPQLEYKNEWIDDYITAFGEKGLIVLAYFFGSLFTVQIRERYKLFPFLEFTGDAGSGKTTVLEFMWKLLGRSNYEGINPTTSTAVGRFRTLSQVSNMPTVYLEGQGADGKTHERAANWLEESKPLFNGRSPRSKGVKNNGNQTSEEPFYGTLIVSQNRKISGEPAILGRYIYLHFDRSHHTPAGRKSAMRLQRLLVDDVSGFLMHAIKYEAEVLQMLEDYYDRTRDEIMSMEGMNTERLGETHGILICCLKALCNLLNISDAHQIATENYIKKIARERENDLESDPEALFEFWEAFEYLQDTHAQVNHKPLSSNQIAINLNEMYAMAASRNIRLDDISLIRGLLPHSKRYKFISNTTVCSVHDTGNKRVRCYVFEKLEA